MSFDKDNVDTLLDDCKGKLNAALVAGFDENGNAFISSSVKNVPYMHWILNRAIFELGLFEKQNVEMKTKKPRSLILTPRLPIANM